MNNILNSGSQREYRFAKKKKKRLSAAMLGIAFACSSIVAPTVAAQESEPMPEAPAPEHRPVPGPQPPECQTGAEADEKALAAFRDSALADSMRKAHKFATGKGVKVAVIDTGVSPHPRLQHVVGVADLLDQRDALHDCDGHGTAVAGIIAATPGEDGFTGVAPDATILAIRQTTSLAERDFSGMPIDKTGDLGTMADAIKVAVDHGADIINMSLTACDRNPFDRRGHYAIMKEAVDYAEQHNVVVVVGAGNESSLCEQGDHVYPAHVEGVVSVSAIRDDWHTFNDVEGGTVLPLTEWTLRGPNRLVSAPGTAPVALLPGSSGLARGIMPPEDKKRRYQIDPDPYMGTSYAAPVIAGSFALLKELYPQDTAAQLRQRLYNVSDPLTGYTDPLSVVTHVNVRSGENVEAWVANHGAPDPSGNQSGSGGNGEQVHLAAEEERNAPKRAVLVAMVILSGGVVLWWGLGMRRNARKKPAATLAATGAATAPATPAAAPGAGVAHAAAQPPPGTPDPRSYLPGAPQQTPQQPPQRTPQTTPQHRPPNTPPAHSPRPAQPPTPPPYPGML